MTSPLEVQPTSPVSGSSSQRPGHAASASSVGRSAPWRAKLGGWACALAALTVSLGWTADTQAAPAKRFASKSIRAKASSGKLRIQAAAVQRAMLPPLPTSMLRQGCLDIAQALSLFGEQGGPSHELRRLAGQSGPSGSAAGSACLPFASVAVAGRVAESLALLPPIDDSGPRRALVVSRSDARAGLETTWRDLDTQAPSAHDLWIPMAAAIREKAEGAAGLVPAALRRELAILLRQMRDVTGADEAAVARVVLDSHADDARLVAVELLDGATGRSLDSVVWMQRDNAPGAFIGTLGADYERTLWQSPLDYTRVSRGVGASVVVLRQRVLARAWRSKARPRYVVRNFRIFGQHVGIDFVAALGTPVVTVADGVVAFAGRRGGYGNLVVVDHGGGHATYYGHLSTIADGLAEGVPVRRGEPIGQVGSTGWSTGPHLHFEIRKDGGYVDPTDASQQLAVWALQPDEHAGYLTRLLQLAATRTDPLARSAVKAVAARPVAAPGSADAGSL